jgi:hypothetical protein
MKQQQASKRSPVLRGFFFGVTLMHVGPFCTELRRLSQDELRQYRQAIQRGLDSGWDATPELRGVYRQPHWVSIDDH